MCCQSAVDLAHFCRFIGRRVFRKPSVRGSTDTWKARRDRVRVFSDSFQSLKRVTRQQEGAYVPPRISVFRTDDLKGNFVVSLFVLALLLIFICHVFGLYPIVYVWLFLCFAYVSFCVWSPLDIFVALCGPLHNTCTKMSY